MKTSSGTRPRCVESGWTAGGPIEFDEEEGFCERTPMSLAQMKDEADKLTAKERQELLAFLVAKGNAEDETYRERLARKIDDNDPAHWMELDEVRARYGV